MVRTRAADFDDKLQLILDTAADVFAGKGYNVATTIDIAVACGMSKSALYHYHKSKEAILHALLHAHLLEVIEDVREAVDDAAPPREQLLSFLTALMESNAVSRSKNIVLLNATDDLPPQQRDEIRRLERKLVQIGAEVLGRLNPKVMSQSSLRGVYSMFLFGLVNWTYTWYEPRGSIEPRAIAERICELFLEGFPNVNVAGEDKKVIRLRSRSTGRAGGSGRAR